MKKTLFLLATLCCGAAFTGNAQEVATEVPVVVKSGLNADLIAEQKITDTSKLTYVESQQDGWTTYYYYASPYATYLDALSRAGSCNAFFTTGVQTDGGFSFTDANLSGFPGYQYFTGTDGNKYYVYHPNETANNAVLVTNTNSTASLTLATIDGMDAFYANNLYFMACATEGGVDIDIELIDSAGEKVNTVSANIPDWATDQGDHTKYDVVVSLKRITVVGSASSQSASNVSTGGSNMYDLNYISPASSTSTQRFVLQKVPSTMTTSAMIDKINVTRKTTNGSANASSAARAAIFTLSASTSEVTEKEAETSLAYLVNTSTKSTIQEEGKYKVNLVRTFGAEWNPFIFNCTLDVKHVLTMFGNDVVLSRADHLTGNRVYFKKVDLSNPDAVAIEPGEFYIIKGITLNTDGDDIETGAGIYSAYNIQYKNPTGTTTTKTFQNTNNDGSSVTFTGTYVNETQIDADAYALSTDGNFYQYSDRPKMKGFRFWFTHKEATGANATKKNSLELFVEDPVTGIATPISMSGTDKGDGNVYTIDGRIVRQGTTSVDGLDKGLYIVNGKKIQVK